MSKITKFCRHLTDKDVKKAYNNLTKYLSIAQIKVKYPTIYKRHKEIDDENFTNSRREAIQGS